MREDNVDLPIEDHFLRVKRIAGGAEPKRAALVFLHDSLGSIGLWRDFPQRLASRTGRDAVVIDRRGYGESSPFGASPRTPRYLEDEARVLEQVLRALDIPKAILFGHSDGGSIALIAAALFPETASAVITEGAHVFVEEVTLDGIRAAKETLRTTNLRERLRRHHGDKTDGVTSAWIDTSLSEPFRDWNIEAYLSRIRCPVLIIQGTDDEFGTAAQVQAIAKGVSGPSESLLIPAVGHTPHREAEGVVVEAVASFLAGSASREALTR